MDNIARMIAITLLVAGLAGCDGKTDDKIALANSNSALAAAMATQPVNLLGGKISFSLPAGMNDQSGKLGTRGNNMHVYADKTGQKAIIVILADNDAESLDVLTNRLEGQQRARDTSLQVIINKAIQINGRTLQQFDSIIKSAGQKAYSSIVLAKVANHLVTMQITLPADNQQQAQTEAKAIISTLKLQ